MQAKSVKNKSTFNKAINWLIKYNEAFKKLQRVTATKKRTKN